MKILLYNPDNGVTRNFMPHLWMFLLQSLTPKEHEVILIDGNAKAMSRDLPLPDRRGRYRTIQCVETFPYRDHTVPGSQWNAMGFRGACKEGVLR